MTYTELAEKSYVAYGEYSNWKNYQGSGMPAWKDLPKSIQNAWMNAAESTVVEVLDNLEEATTMSKTEICPRFITG